MTERMAEQDDPFLAGDTAQPRHPCPRIPILPGEWQLPTAQSTPRRRKRQAPPGGASTNGKG